MLKEYVSTDKIVREAKLRREQGRDLITLRTVPMPTSEGRMIRLHEATMEDCTTKGESTTLL